MKSFEDAGQGKRKWMCFVCGKNYDTYEEYKEHIATEHEEGREYIKCPVCDAPVRDMKSHFKVKHPNRIMPKKVQQRVVIWHDYSPSGRKKRTRKPAAQSGYFTSHKMKRDFHYRSRMECNFYECLEVDEDVLYYEAEPFKIPYMFNGEWHNYIPDIRVHYADNTDQIWEVKPDYQTDYDINKAKWSSANSHCQGLGWDFVVQTEDALKSYREKIKRQQNRKLNG